MSVTAHEPIDDSWVGRVGTRGQARVKMSAVWMFFTVSGEDKGNVTCNKCSAEVPRGGKSIKNFNSRNLISHLKTFHGNNLFKEHQAASISESSVEGAAIQEAFEKCRKFTSPKVFLMVCAMTTSSSLYLGLPVLSGSKVCHLMQLNTRGPD